MKTIKASWCIFFVALVTACGDASNGNSISSADAANSGTGGSMARFTVVDDMLYAISGNFIQLVDIEDPSQPALWNRINVSWDIETLFSYDDYMFVGSQSGVFIYDKSTPEFPQFLSEFNHVRSCDPVVVQGDYAYVTLRGNARCWGATNQLDILNISDILNPTLVHTYPMQEPFGLGISENKLFICDGNAGLKVFDVTEKTAIQLIESESKVQCFDVIPHNDILIVSAESGLLQYSYENELLEKLSEIPVESQIANDNE